MKKFMYSAVEKTFESKGYDYNHFYNLMSDLVFNRLENISVREANEEIREYFLSLFHLTKEDTRSPKLMTRAIRQYTPAMFEVIEEVVEELLQEGWQKDPFFMQFVEVRNVADGDAIEFWVEDDVKIAVHKFAGDHHDITVQTIGGGHAFTVTGERYVAAVGAHIRSYLLGNVDFSKMISLIYEAFDLKIKETCYAELADLGNKLPAGSPFNLAIQFSQATKDQFDRLLMNVDIVNGGYGVVILGTRVGLKNLQKFTELEYISSDMKNELYKTGRLGYYEGTPLIELKQNVKVNSDRTQITDLIANDQLIILGVRATDKPIKLVNFGNPYSYEVTQRGDRMDDTMKFEYSEEFGIITIITEYPGNVKILP